MHCIFIICDEFYVVQKATAADSCSIFGRNVFVIPTENPCNGKVFDVWVSDGHLTLSKLALLLKLDDGNWAILF